MNIELSLSKYSSIVIYGLGKSGISCLEFLISQKYPNVFAIDDNDDMVLFVKDRLGKKFGDNIDINSIFINQSELSSKIDGNSRVVFAPGIPLYFPEKHRILDIANDSFLVSDIDFFNEIFLDDSSVNKDVFNIGVTGTNGKSTISSFIDYIFQDLAINSSLVGNIGVPIFDVANQLSRGQSGKSCLVTEISSFQLDLLKNTGFDVACISNIADDHIERHGSFKNYVNSKLRIFKNSTKDDYLIINYDDPVLRGIYEGQLQDSHGSKVILTSLSQNIDNGVMVFNNKLRIKLFDFDATYDISAISIPGEHNKENYCIVIASILCYLRKSGVLTRHLLDKAIKTSLLFCGIKHRMQFLGAKNKVSFVNDSKATNPVSVNYALNSYDNVFLIFGGYDKGADLDVLKGSLSKIKKVYIVGKSTQRIEKFLKINDVKYENCFNLDIAFSKSFIDAKNFNCNAPVVMLSPGCASFDQWRNFEERGDYFCKLFNEIK